MKFKEQTIIFNKVFSRTSPLWDTEFGRMRPNFKCVQSMVADSTYVDNYNSFSFINVKTVLHLQY